jgi:SnoaL-like domain
MSQENVEVVRQIYEAMGESDFDRMLTYWDARGDYYPVQKFPEAQPCHGIEDIRRFFVEFGLGVDLVESRIDGLTPVGDDRVLVRLRLSYVGKTSGVKVSGELFHCFWLRHGRVFRQEDHLTLPGALRALGLEGETLEAVGLHE